MDQVKWEKYEAKMKALRKQYRKNRWGTRLIWLLCNAAVVAVKMLFFPRRVDFWFIVLLFVFVSSLIMFFEIAKWNKAERHQEELLMNETPFDRFQL